MKKNSLRADFIREMQIRNYSERTISNYVAALAKVAQFHQLSPDEINMEQFKNFLHHRISEDKVSVSVINQTISAFKIMQTDVLGREWETFKVKRPRKEKKLPVVMSVDEINQMIGLAKNVKHRALMALAYSTGMRKGEVQSLKINHIDSKRMQVFVARGKGKKSRYTILSDKALQMLRLYYSLEKPKTYLFEPQGKKGMPLSNTSLNNIVTKAAQRAGIKKNVSFHTLRHSFATHMLEKGINLRLIQKLMGHTSLKTTSSYLHIANIEPGRITSPLDEMTL